MLRIRLSRVGRKHDPSYRLIVTERGRGPQTGNYVEQVGTYDARSDAYTLEEERIDHWLSVGAQPSDTVHNLLVKAGVIEADTVNPLPKKSPIVSEETDAADGSDEDSAEADEASGDADNEEAAAEADETEAAAEDDSSDADDQASEDEEVDSDAEATDEE